MCVRARFFKFGLKKGVEVVRRVLSVERKQMDRRMERNGLGTNGCVWCGGGFRPITKLLLLSVTIDYKYRDITSKEN